jgi:flagellar M-ring protein FliF
MDFLSRAYSQLYDLYRSMTPSSRLTAGLLASVVLLSLGYLFTHQISSPEVDLMHGQPLSAPQLSFMEGVLGKAGLKCEVRGTSILVPRGQEAACMAALADANALPKQPGDALRNAINSTGWCEDHRLREQRYQTAKQDELAKAIGEMPGIEHAYVVYDVDNKPGFNKEKVTTALACVKPAGSGQLNESQVSAIRRLVGGGAIAGLRPENVTISDLNGGRTWYANAEDNGSGGEENLYLAVQRTYEQDLRAKILNALCYIPNVTVELSVVLDRERITRIKQDRRSPDGKRRTGGEATGGRVKDSHPDRSGAVVQRPNTGTVLNALLGGGHSNDEPQESEAADLGSREQVEKESVGLTPLQARVSVSVPVSYFKRVWQERNPIEAGQPAAKPNTAALEQIRAECCAMIQKHVATLLPLPENAAKAAELVTVTIFQDIPIQEPPPPDFNQTLLSWLRQSWTTLGMIAVAMVSLLVLRSMVRARPVAAHVQTISASASLHDELDISLDGGKADDSREPKIPPPHARRFSDAGAPLREELSELVETDPDAAVNVLRNWIGPVDGT